MSNFDPIRRVHIYKATPGYFPFGSTRSRNLFHKWFPLPEDVTKVLLLGCGDLRHVFHTIAELPGNGLKLEFHLNDLNPSVIARNVLILHLVSSPRFQPNETNDLIFLWDIWYNFDWSLHTTGRFLKLLDELEQSVHWRIFLPRAEDVETVVEIWQFWKRCISATDRSILAKYHRIRKENLIRDMAEGKNVAESEYETIFRDTTRQICSAFGPCTTLKPSTQSLMDCLLVPVFNYYRTGNVRSQSEKPTTVTVNPTLLQPYSRCWDIHFTVTPLHSYFPIPNEQLVLNPDVIQFCRAVLASRVAAFRKSIQQHCFQAFFYIEDAVQFCLEKRVSSVDVIDTSTLADDFGLINLLLLVPPLLHSDSSIMYSSTINMRFISRKSYVAQVLGIPVTMVPSIFGVRLMDDFIWGNETPYGDKGRLYFLLRWSIPAWPTNPKPTFSTKKDGTVQQCLQLISAKCTGILTSYAHSGLAAYTQLTMALLLRSMTSRFDFCIADALSHIKMPGEFQFSWETIVDWVLGKRKVLQCTAKNVPVCPSFKIQSNLTIRPRLRYTLYQVNTAMSSYLNCNVIPAFAYIDNVRVDVMIRGANQIETLSFSFLLPESHIFHPEFGAFQLFDMASQLNLTAYILFRELDVQPMTESPLLLVREPPVFIQHGPLSVCSVEETASCYTVLLRCKGFEDSCPPLDIVGNQRLPCRTVNQVSVKIAGSHQIPLELTFTCPVVIGRSHMERVNDRSFLKVELIKIVEEPWAEDFDNSRKNFNKIIVDHLPAWETCCSRDILERHLEKQGPLMTDFFLSHALSAMPALSPSSFLLEVVRDIFVAVSSGLSCLVLKSLPDASSSYDAGLFVLVHGPLLRYSQDGTPLMCLTVYDRQAALLGIRTGLLDADRTCDNLKRIVSLLDSSNPTLLQRPYSSEKLYELRLLLRRNALVMEPTSWQKAHIPSGPAEPWLATFLTPMYADNSVQLSPEFQKLLESINQLNAEQDSGWKNVCDKCSLKICGPLKVCSRCRGAFYCSRTCQTRDWSLHKKICGRILDDDFSD